ncbi:eukaryotic phosphomannomutase [Schizopora paradoxa]|uniref:Phosphomannomutase n=1 Tax=Schizopora paradoxa TaxID=27342 RepID=A0A0H2SDH9_9AGAM|nr:eukaryotic phosphomannomutase [Schizopora paradoxa]
MINGENPVQENQNRDVLVLFDVDGTLVPPRGRISAETMQLVRELRCYTQIGFIGGSTLRKALWQLGDSAVNEFDYAFAECGIVSYTQGVALPGESFISFLGEENYKLLVNFILHYIADLELPIKRGTFVEYRQGLLNICPQGRDTTGEEQERFEAYDKIHQVRMQMIGALVKRFPSFNLVCAIGGRTSFDLFPRGWDKTYALRHLDMKAFKEVHYLGDKFHLGGNDYEMFHHPSVIGHEVSGPPDTESFIRGMLGRYETNNDQTQSNSAMVNSIRLARVAA